MLKDKYITLINSIKSIPNFDFYISPHDPREIKPPFIMIDFEGDSDAQNYTTGTSELTSLDFTIHISSEEVKPNNELSKETAILNLADNIELLLSTTSITVENATKKTANSLNNYSFYIQSIKAKF